MRVFFCPKLPVQTGICFWIEICLEVLSSVSRIRFYNLRLLLQEISGLAEVSVRSGRLLGILSPRQSQKFRSLHMRLARIQTNMNFLNCWRECLQEEYGC